MSYDGSHWKKKFKDLTPRQMVMSCDKHMGIRHAAVKCMNMTNKGLEVVKVKCKKCGKYEVKQNVKG